MGQGGPADGLGLVSTRWRRYGKDRVYVETADGVKVGWWDLKTNESHPERPDLTDSLAQARARWAADESSGQAPLATDMSGDGSLGESSFVASSSEPQLAAIDASAPPWIDLAANVPGSAAREQAISARDAAPVKTRLARVLGVHTNERAWRLGADGEEKVADQLSKAARRDSRWRFLHAVPVGDRGSDIDHVVIGPGGVFTINTKHHPGAKIWVSGETFMVDGQRQPYVRNSRYEADRAARLLTAACGFAVHVEGVIVTVNGSDVVVKKPPSGVTVTWRKAVASWLLKHGDILSASAIDAVYEAARRSTTWR